MAERSPPRAVKAPPILMKRAVPRSSPCDRAYASTELCAIAIAGNARAIAGTSIFFISMVEYV